jgi:NAD+ diphosphatase
LAPPADIRTIATRGLLSAGDTAAAGLARSLFAWHDASRFCGACGAAADLIDAGWRRRCGGCGRDQYPRVDPVVIMLVTDGARCVLAHEPRFPDRMFSCIAGYVEPGEDVAHAVGRETAEELGLAVERVKIVADQPWPLPHSLMIGCIAHVAPAALTIDPTEIAEARWFTRAEADALLARSHPDGIWIPGAQAIAHHLIARFARGDDLP